MYREIIGRYTGTVCCIICVLLLQKLIFNFQILLVFIKITFWLFPLGILDNRLRFLFLNF